MIYVLTGRLGSGKSLLAVQRMIDYAAEGKRVAANFPVDFSPLVKDINRPFARAAVTVLSPYPSVDELLMLGQGGKFEDESGLLVLDECSHFLNARSWGDKERQGLLDWMSLSRKRCWDVFLIVQHEGQLDKQVRSSFPDYLVNIRRLDRMKIPFTPLKFPRLHIGTVRYGMEANAMVADRWVTRGAEPMQCYNTAEIFADLENAPFTVLPSVLTKRWYEGCISPTRYTPQEIAVMPAALLVYTACKVLNYSAPIKPVLPPQKSPKLPLVELLAKLPEADRLRHWKRLNELGAFG